MSDHSVWDNDSCPDCGEYPPNHHTTCPQMEEGNAVMVRLSNLVVGDIIEVNDTQFVVRYLRNLYLDRRELKPGSLFNSSPVRPDICFYVECTHGGRGGYIPRNSTKLYVLDYDSGITYLQDIRELPDKVKLLNPNNRFE